MDEKGRIKYLMGKTHTETLGLVINVMLSESDWHRWTSPSIIQSFGGGRGYFWATRLKSKHLTKRTIYAKVCVTHTLYSTLFDVVNMGVVRHYSVRDFDES